MWGTSSPGDKLTGDFGNEPDATSISDRGLFRLLAGNLPAGVFRLLQHNRPRAGPEVLHQRRDNLAHGVSSAFGRIRSQARARFGDADRKVPSDPEHDKIARDESQKAGVGRRVALDHQTEPNRERLTDYHANDERQQQGHGLTL
jgi:hypothetical protein